MNKGINKCFCEFFEPPFLQMRSAFPLSNSIINVNGLIDICGLIYLHMWTGFYRHLTRISHQLIFFSNSYSTFSM